MITDKGTVDIYSYTDVRWLLIVVQLKSVDCYHTSIRKGCSLLGTSIYLTKVVINKT